MEINKECNRNRKLSLDELVYISLIEYPVYRSIKKSFYLTPELALEEIKELKNKEIKYSLYQKTFRWWGYLKDIIKKNKALKSKRFLSKL